MKYEVKMTGTKRTETIYGTEKVVNEYSVGNYSVKEHIFNAGTETENRMYYCVCKILKNGFEPEIYAKDSLFDGGVSGFEVKIVACGLLGAVNMKHMIEAYTEALDVVEALTDYFCK